MTDNDEKRLAGDYEIIHAVHIGDREIVVGESQADNNGEKYMTAFCQSNELFAKYFDVLVSDDYAETMQNFGKRIEEQAEKARNELLAPCLQGIDITPLTEESCNALMREDDLLDRVVVINTEVLRREYRLATYQLNLCTGGFGAHPNSRGSAVYCKNLYSGREARYERRDILGTLKKEQLPEWAELGLKEIERNERKRQEPER